MGYQESFIHTTTSDIERNNKDVEKYLEIFKKYNIRCEGDWLATCCMKFHFNENVGIYKKGMDVLLICGERQAQRSCYRLFDVDYQYPEDKVPSYREDELELIKRAKITFIEEQFDVLEAEKDGHSITIKQLELMPRLSPNHNEML